MPPSLADQWRGRFPIFQDKIFLNSCSYGALSHEVEAAYHAYLGSRHARGADWERWVGKNEAVRAAFARIVNAAPDEIAVTASASASFNSLVSALAPKDGRNKVVLSDFEFPTAGQIWHAQEPRGFEVVHAREVDGMVPPEEFDRLIDDRTLIVSLAHVCYRNGAMNDVAAAVRLARERGAMVLLDAYQALGAVPIDIKALDVDFLIGGPLKYLLSSAGAGFLYVRAPLAERLSPFATGWFAQADVAAMEIHHHDPSPTARRFEAGTPPIPSLYAAEAGLAMIERIGVGAIHKYVRILTARLKDGVHALGAKLATPEDPECHGAMVAIKSTDDHALVAALEADKIITSCRDGNVRVSPHFYNTEGDIDALLAGLERHRMLLA